MDSMSRRASAALLFAILFSFPLCAQLKIEKTEPLADSMSNIAPKQIQVWFKDTMFIKAVRINLRGPAGVVKLGIPVSDADSISASVVGTLPDGAYVATWQVTDNGGRVQSGQFRFIVRAK